VSPHRIPHGPPHVGLCLFFLIFGNPFFFCGFFPCVVPPLPISVFPTPIYDQGHFPRCTPPVSFCHPIKYLNQLKLGFLMICRPPPSLSRVKLYSAVLLSRFLQMKVGLANDLPFSLTLSFILCPVLFFFLGTSPCLPGIRCPRGPPPSPRR